MPSNALSSFDSQMELVDNLIDIHGRIQSGKGRRHRQEAIHRAGVVLTVAAWQAYIEKLCEEVLELVESSFNQPGVPAWVKSSFAFRKPAVRQSIGAFSTPNSEKVRDLL